jgi:hypothetical protein
MRPRPTQGCRADDDDDDDDDEDDHLRVETRWSDVQFNKVVTSSYTSAFVGVCLIPFDAKLESVFGVMN